MQQKASPTFYFNFLAHHPNLELATIRHLVEPIGAQQIRGHSIELLPKP